MKKFSALLFLLVFFCFAPSRSLAATAQPRPDVTIGSVSFDPTTRAPTVVFKNIGTAPALLGAGSGYMSSSNASRKVTPGVSIATLINFPAILAPGQSWTFSSAGKPGPDDVKLSISVNPQSKVTESNESNNKKELALPELPLPDLIVDSVTFESGTRKPTVVFKNIGKAPAVLPGAFGGYASSANAVEKVISGVSLATYITFPTTSLAPGASWTYAYLGKPGPDDVTLYVEVDSQKKVKESNESNNSKKFSLPAPLLPDITVDAITFDPATRKPTIVFKNIGVAAALFPDQNDGYISTSDIYGVAKAGVSIASFINFPDKIDAGESWSYQADIPHVDEVSLSVTADSEKRVKESNEVNNTKKVRMPDVALPDIVVQNIQYDPATRKPTVTFKNIGAAPALLPGTNDVYIASVDFDGKANTPAGIAEYINLPDTLVPGQTWVYIENALPHERDYKLRFDFDPEKKLKESNEQNNMQHYNMPPVTLPDLAIESMEIDAATGKPTIVVKNTGTIPAVFPSGTGKGKLVSYNAGGNVVAGSSISESINLPDTLAPGQAWTYVGGVVPSTDIRLKVAIDIDGKLRESNEANNEKTLVITNNAKPDFAISSIYLNPTTRRAFAGIENVGNAPARSRFDGVVTYTLDILTEDRSVIGSQQLGTFSQELTIRNNKQISFPGVIPAEARLLVFKIDTTNGVAELDETNNTKELVIQGAAQPNLVVDSIVVDAATKKVTAVIKNIGAVMLASETVINNMTAKTVNGDLVDSDVSRAPLTRLASGETLSRTFSKAITDQAVSITVSVDSTNVVVESDEDDNQSTIQVIPENAKASDLLAVDEKKTVDSIASAAGATSPTEITKVLPGDPVYIFKDLSRVITSTFTFDTEKKADLTAKFANEKLLEANALVDQGKSSEAVRVIGSYKKDVTTLKNLAEQLQDKKDEKKSDDLVLGMLSDQFKSNVILDKVEKATKGEEKVAIIEAKSTIKKDTTDALNEANVSDEALKKELAASLGGSNGSLRSIKDLEVVKDLQDTLPESKKYITEGITKDTSRQLASSLNGLSQEQKKLLPQYLRETGSDIGTIKVLDDLKFGDSDSQVKAAILQAEDDAVEELGKEILATKKNEQNAAGVILDDLKAGTFENIRILARLEDNVTDNGIKEDIGELKKETSDALSQKLVDLDDNKRPQFIKEEVEEKLDVDQVRVVNDLEKSLQDKGVASEIKEELDGAIKEKVTTKETDKDEYDEFVTSFVGDDPEDLEYIKKYVTIGGQTFEEDLIKAQIGFFEDYYDGVTDPKELAEINDFIDNNEEWRDVFEEYADENFWDSFEENKSDDDIYGMPDREEDSEEAKDDSSYDMPEKEEAEGQDQSDSSYGMPDREEAKDDSSYDMPEKEDEE